MRKWFARCVWIVYILMRLCGASLESASRRTAKERPNSATLTLFLGRTHRGDKAIDLRAELPRLLGTLARRREHPARGNFR